MPLILGDADALTCPGCGAQTPVPDAYRDLQRARHDDVALRAQAERVLRKLDRPPTIVTKVLARILDLPMLAFIALYGIPVGLFAIVKADKLNYWLAPRLHLESANDVPFGYMVAAMFGLLFVIAFIPRAFGVYANRRASARGQLLASLRAHPPKIEGGASTCRSCGAPLEIATDAIVATCSYCRAENAIVLETRTVATTKQIVGKLGKTIAEVAVRDRADRRATIRLLVNELGRYLFRTVVLAGLFMLGTRETPDHKTTKLGVLGLVLFLVAVVVFIFRSGTAADHDDATQRRSGNDVPAWVGYVGPIVTAYLLFKLLPYVAL